MDFRIQLKAKDKDSLGSRLLAEIQAGMGAKTGLDERIKRWVDQYEGVTGPKDDPWVGCSNLHVPLTAWQVDTVSSNLYSTVFTTDPVIRCEPVEGGDDDDARDLEAWLQYLQGRVGLKGGRGKELSLATSKAGTAIGKLTHETWAENQWEMGEDGDVTPNRVTRRGIQFRVVPMADFVMCPATALSIMEAVAVGDRKKVRLEDVKRNERVGLYDKGTAKAVESVAGADAEPTEPTEQQETIGVEAGAQSDKQFDTYDRWEMIWALPVVQKGEGKGAKWTYDPDHDKAEERDCLVTIIDVGGKPVIGRIMLYPWFHGRRHYIPFRILPRDGQLWGRSIPEVLEALQDELNTEHNQRIDWRSLVLNRPLKVRRGASITSGDGKMHIEWKPGHPIIVDDMTDMEFPDVPPIGADSYKEEEGIIGFAERVTAVSDQRVGQISEGKNTLGEVQLTESLGNVRFDDMVQAFQGYGDYREGVGLRELCYQMIGLSVQFCREEMVRVLGEESKLPQLSMEDATGAYDYAPQGNTIGSNVQARRQQAGMMYEKLMQNPLVGQNPMRVWALTKALLDAFGEKNFQSIIGTEEEIEQMMQQMEQQKQAEAEAQQRGGEEEAMREAEEQGYRDGADGLADVDEEELVGAGV